MVAKKVKYILMFVSLSICLCLMSSTYSRYVANTQGNIEVLFAKWQILVNTFDVTDSANSSITIVPEIEDNPNVASNLMAPSSKGYFDIEINPTNVDVSFKYTISLDLDNEDIPDLVITKYAFLPDDYINGDLLNKIDLIDGEITNKLFFDKDEQFEPFTIRVFFEWYDDQINKTMTDDEQTEIGIAAANDDEIKFQMKADISFEQIFE